MTDIILTDVPTAGPALTTIRVVENRQIEQEAAKGLHLPEGAVYVHMQFGVVETSHGYFVVDHEGGHMTLPMEIDERITLLVFSHATRNPVAENKVTIKHILKHYARQTMPVADFVSNRDGMEERWRKLVTTLLSAGVDVAGDVARRAANNASGLITGGSLPLDPKKL